MIKRKIILILSILIFPFLITSCGTGKENVGEKGGLSNDSVYVFDQPLTPPPPPDTVSVKPKEQVTTPTPPPVYEVTYYYIIQIGAFKSNEKATKFADLAKKEISNKIEISYSSRVNLYVVHLMPPFITKAAAQKAREELWKKNKFKDAWILTVQK